MELPKTYNPKEVEGLIYSFWEETGLFNPDKLSGKRKEKFVVPIAPPNITGELHMGHALENILVDVLVRKERMKGKKTLWVPGTDHAGIATQNMVEKELRKEGKTRFDLGREKFIERVWQWKEKYGGIILDQLKKLGCSCDWSRTRFTMDKNYSKAVEQVFLHYYNKGWIYQGERVINWCKRCQTSLSDLELEYKEERGKLYYIRYLVKGLNKGKQTASKNYITVATTRPETMLGDTALSVNPQDKRYKNLVGKKAILPLLAREIPIIEDPAIDKDFGTGVLKVTPAHDLTDWEIAKRHKLPGIKIIDEEGRMTKESKICEGLTPLECRAKVVKELKRQGLLEKIEDHLYLLPYCYRCHTLIEPILSKQWFLKMEELSQKAIEAVKNGKVKFQPKRFEKIYFTWLENVKDWCISRQIWWGHQLPVWQCQRGRNSKLQIPKSKLKEKYFISLGKPRKCPLCGKCRPKQVDDVLDTWFSSALWPFAILGWPQKTPDLKEFYPHTLVSSARDIINLWIARMIFSGLEFMKKPPFATVFIHGTILTKEGKRMSKSLGTGIDPLELVEKYGGDATRFGLIWQATGLQDIRFDEGTILTGKKFCNKVWNASRFILREIENSKSQSKKSKLQLKKEKLTLADRKILNGLQKTIKAVNEELEDFRFGQALQALYHFFWHQFCDIYLEESKRQLKIKSNTQETINVLIYVLFTSLKLLHPFLPFITEQIYQKLPIEDKKESIMIEEWPEKINF